MRNRVSRDDLELKKASILSRILHYCALYGCVRVATLDFCDGVGLVLASPPMMVSGDIPITPFTIYDEVLFDDMEDCFGTVQAAADFFSLAMSLHFKESKEEG